MKLDKNNNIVIGHYRIKSNSIAEKVLAATGVTVGTLATLICVYGTVAVMYLLP